MSERLDDIDAKLESLLHLADVVTEKYERNARKRENSIPDDLILIQV